MHLPSSKFYCHEGQPVAQIYGIGDKWTRSVLEMWFPGLLSASDGPSCRLFALKPKHFGDQNRQLMILRRELTKEGWWGLCDEPGCQCDRKCAWDYYPSKICCGRNFKQSEIWKEWWSSFPGKIQTCQFSLLGYSAGPPYVMHLNDWRLIRTKLSKNCALLETYAKSVWHRRVQKMIQNEMASQTARPDSLSKKSFRPGEKRSYVSDGTEMGWILASRVRKRALAQYPGRNVPDVSPRKHYI